MAENPKNPEIGGEAYHWADDAVKPLILEQAARRVESTLPILTAINSRLASLCGLLFAGAALSTTVATSVDKLSTPPRIAATIAAFFFAFGGLASFVGLVSSKRVFAGEPLSWWVRGEGVDGLKALRELDRPDAEYWIASHEEKVIQSLNKGITRRGVATNVSIGLGAAGGLLIPVSASLAMAYPEQHTPSPPTIVTCRTVVEALPIAPTKQVVPDSGMVTH